MNGRVWAQFVPEKGHNSTSTQRIITHSSNIPTFTFAVFNWRNVQIKLKRLEQYDKCIQVVKKSEDYANIKLESDWLCTALISFANYSWIFMENIVILHFFFEVENSRGNYAFLITQIVSQEILQSILFFFPWNHDPRISGKSMNNKSFTRIVCTGIKNKHAYAHILYCLQISSWECI